MADDHKKELRDDHSALGGWDLSYRKSDGSCRKRSKVKREKQLSSKRARRRLQKNLNVDDNDEEL